MKRGLFIAAVGVPLALASCDFNAASTKYCEHPGRCAAADGGVTLSTRNGSRQICQGDLTTYTATVRGRYLSGADASVRPPGPEVTVVSNDGSDIVLNVKVPHGVDVGPRELLLDFERSEDQQRVPNFIEVTPIVVANDGSDATGLGTYESPLATLYQANVQAAGGDTIHARAGTYDSAYPTPGTACAAGGLKHGVSVEGELLPDAGLATTIGGTRAAGACAFLLSDPGQTLSALRIQNFEIGILATDGGAGSGPSRVSDVLADLCNLGVKADPGSNLSLQRVSTDHSSQSGLLVQGGTVLFQNGTVNRSDGPGVEVNGDGGSLVMAGVTVSGSGASQLTDVVFTTAQQFLGAGLSIKSKGASVSLTGSSFLDNCYVGIVAGGSGNVLTIDGGTIQAAHQLAIGLSLVGTSGDAVVRLGNATFTGVDSSAATGTTGIKIEGAGAFNAGDGTNPGNNVLGPTGAFNYLEIHDARPSGSPDLQFRGTQIHGAPRSGTVTGPINSGGIAIDGVGNNIVF